MNTIIVLILKIVSAFIKLLNLGHGSTWPGHIALIVDKNFIKNILKTNPALKIILVAGTNGKTTTTTLLRFLLEKSGLKVFQNESGANLLNGIASSLIINSSLAGKLPYNVALFEVDENTLPPALKEAKPYNLLILNLFRDQLDRYGEVNTIAKKWQQVLSTLSRSDLGTHQYSKTLLFINGDDPQLTFISEQSKLTTIYFGLEEKEMKKKDLSHDVDFKNCPKCHTELIFEKISYSHMGKFKCPKCGFTNKKIERLNISHYPLFGLYNYYNINAASLIANKVFNISEKDINSALSEFKPAFGRQEVIAYKGKKIIILLSKNPTSFNQSLKAVSEQKGKYILLVLNDRIPDGRDVSWIWDVDFEDYIEKGTSIFISGDRAYDMALRVKYAEIPDTKYQIHESLKNAINKAIESLKPDQILYILPTYSAMLEVRKILTGKKIL